MTLHPAALRRLALTFVVVPLGGQYASADTLKLNMIADNDSSFFEYFSDGFMRMDQFAPLFPTHQNLHAISDPSVNYGQGLDGFPNDRYFRFGSVEYDSSSIVGGTGLAPITALSLGIAKDPANSAYENWRRFTTNTLLVDDDDADADAFSGTIEFAGGLPVGVDLVADVQLEVVGALGATITGYYPGQFVINGGQFEFQAEGMPVLDTIFGTSEFHLKWDFSGRLSTIVADAGDYDGDGRVDGTDFLLWQRTLGAEVEPDGSAADGDESGLVDAGDLVVWKDNFGTGPQASLDVESQAVPEPAAWTAALVALGALAAMRRRSPFSSEA